MGSTALKKTTILFTFRETFLILKKNNNNNNKHKQTNKNFANGIAQESAATFSKNSLQQAGCTRFGPRHYESQPAQ